MILNLVAVFCLLSVLSAQDKIRQVSLVKYVEIVSFAINVPIYIADDVDTKISFFIPRDFDKSLLFKTLDSTLREKNLYLKRIKDIYIVKKIVPEKYYSYKFKFINPKDVNSTLAIFSDLKYSYLPFTNTVVFNTNENTFKKAKNMLQSIDIFQPQRKIKLTIFTTNIDKVLELGSKTDGITIDLDNFLSSVFSSSSTYSTYTASNSVSFKSTLNYLVNDGISKIKQSPILTLRDGEKTSVSFVENIPYQVSTTSVSDGTSTTSETTEYKDVGLKIKIVPRLYQDFSFLDFSFVNETILTQGDKPTTQKVSYNSKFELKNNELFVISGFTKTDNYTEITKIPLLGDLPLLEYLFKYKNDVNSSTIISLMVEYIK